MSDAITRSSRAYAESMTPTTTSTALARAAARGGHPAVTWYGPGGDRVELSGAVLVNWVTKTTNLLVEELDAGPGSILVLDLPPHWRSVVWALAAWRAGASVAIGAPASDDATRIVVTDRPESHPQARDLVVVTLGALARRYPGELPAGAVDAASAVMMYSDALGWVPPTEPASLALEGRDRVDHATLAEWADGASIPAGHRVALPADDLEDLLRAALAALRSDTSLVLLSPEMRAELDADPERKARMLASERVDAEG